MKALVIYFPNTALKMGGSLESRLVEGGVIV